MKYYFWPDNDELMCFRLSDIKDQMLRKGISEAEVYEARIVRGEGFFFCSEFQEVGESGDMCGKQCAKYSPRNGKSGRCRYHGGTYEPSEKVKTIKLKRMETKIIYGLYDSRYTTDKCRATLYTTCDNLKEVKEELQDFTDAIVVKETLQKVGHNEYVVIKSEIVKP